MVSENKTDISVFVLSPFCTRVSSCGLADLPLLMAMLADETLTPVDSQASGRGQAFHHYGFDDGDLDARTEQIHQSMRRPLTRGEVALQILQPPVFQERNAGGGRRYRDPSSASDPAERLAPIRAWFEKVKGGKPLEPARLYFVDGQSQQREQDAPATFWATPLESSALLRPSCASRSARLARGPPLCSARKSEALIFNDLRGKVRNSG